MSSLTIYIDINALAHGIKLVLYLCVCMYVFIYVCMALSNKAGIILLKDICMYVCMYGNLGESRCNCVKGCMY